MAGDGLSTDEVTVRYGAVVAVDRLTLDAPLGRITGLMGPNGAGKSSFFDACSGFLKPTTGTVKLHGEDVTKLSPAVRARKGLGRTFQRVELWNTQTVRANIAMGREGALAGANPFRQLVGGRGDRRRVLEAAAQALELCGLESLADTEVGGLSTGQRRLVELARCLAGAYDVLILDEPSSGLDHNETERFGEVLKRVTRERGTGILLVEHDMALVMDVCEHLYVLDVGQLLFQGTPDEVRSSDVVQMAYLGAPATT